MGREKVAGCLWNIPPRTGKLRYQVTLWTDHQMWPLACSCSALISTFECGVARRAGGQGLCVLGSGASLPGLQSAGQFAVLLTRGHLPSLTNQS